MDEPAVWRIKGAKMKRMSLTWDFVVKNGMALPGKGGGIGPRLVQTILRCADTQPGPLRVPVWGTMTEVAEAPWSVAEWAAALGFDHPRDTVLVLRLSDTPLRVLGFQTP